MKGGWAAAGALLALLLTSPAAAQQPSAAERQAAQAISDAMGLMNTDLAGAERGVRAVIADRSFRSLPPELQAGATRALSLVLVNDADAHCAELARLNDELIAREGANADLDGLDWQLAFWAASDCNDDARADAALTIIVQRHREVLETFTDDAILRSAMRLHDQATLRYLVDGGWRPKDADTDLSALRLSLVRLYLQQHDLERARETAQALTTADSAYEGVIVVLFSERVFDPVIASDPEVFNFDSIMAWQLRSAEARALSEPNSLALQNQYAQALLARNRMPEALAVVDAVIDRARAAPNGPPAFDDQEDQLNWTHDVRAEIVNAMGDREEALQARMRGVEAGEDGGLNVSQLLNRASDLVALDRGAEALQAIASFGSDHASPYGQMVGLRIRSCAYAQIGDNANARAVLAEMRQRAEDSEVQVRDAALCNNDLDLAARMFARLMEDPNQRMRTVIGLQHFLDDDKPMTDYEQEIEVRRNALRARRDVRAIIDRIVHIRTFPIRQP